MLCRAGSCVSSNISLLYFTGAIPPTSKPSVPHSLDSYYVSSISPSLCDYCRCLQTLVSPDSRSGVVLRSESPSPAPPSATPGRHARSEERQARTHTRSCWVLHFVNILFLLLLARLDSFALVSVVFSFIIMSFKALPLRRLLSSRSLPASSCLSAKRAFSTTPARDATWGFVGLGQMGMLFINPLFMSTTNLVPYFV